MTLAYYIVCLGCSMVLLLVYVFLWHKHFDVHITLLFILVPLVNLGYTMLAGAHCLEAALVAKKLTYIGGCFLLLLMMLVVFSLCELPLGRWLRVGLLSVSMAVFGSALTIGHLPIFYRSVSFRRIGHTGHLHAVFGPMHTVFYCMVLIYFLLGLVAMIYTYLRKNQVSRKLIYLLSLPVVVCMLSFFVGRLLVPQVELVALAYVFSLAMCLVIVRRMCLYDVTDLAIDSLVETGDTGFVSVDFHYNYLGSNETAKTILPALRVLTVDKPITRSEWMTDHALPWLTAFRNDETKNRQIYRQGDRAYQVMISYLFDGRRKRGYQLFLTDDTANQDNIRLIRTFNDQLQREVEEKTAHIVEMHDHLIMGLAAMVDGRDNLTGGHIKRTSEGVRLLTEAMQEEAGGGLPEEFCRDLIKAAPMHDLGKITIDDDILRKPGRFTPEEYEKMKTHAAEGARIVREILEGTDDPSFLSIAENVAHYHHERWDGSGYPEGLRGEAIPREARIMAVADVYDALVSKRVYKEKLSFTQADAIILEGMGAQFDPGLEPVYRRARPRLEAYYTSLD